MNDLKAQLGFVRELVTFRGAMVYHGYVHRDPLARLHLRTGHEDPYPLYRQIAARGLVSRTPLGNFQTASHAVVSEVLRDRRFGVEIGDRIGSSAHHRLSFLELDPRTTRGCGGWPRPRSVPRHLKSFETRITGVVERLLSAVPATETFDLVSALAAPMPIAVITDLLGIPDADAEEFSYYGATIGSALSGVQSIAHARRLVAAERELTRIFAGLFELKRREPGDDVISRLVAAEGDTIQPDELVPLCKLLLIAGFETTVNLIGNTVMALLEHPEQWRLLTKDPELAGRAVEETLRYDAPVQRTVRHAGTELVLRGTSIDAGQTVVLLIGGANRDPDAYPDPDRFDLLREPTAEHLAFSAGIHYCLGAPLARLEATIAVRSLAERFPDLARSGESDVAPGR